MKSKRAENHINKADGESKILYRFEAITAVEIAEEDARERAIKAYCDHCEISSCTKAYYAGGCDKRLKFEKGYDND